MPEDQRFWLKIGESSWKEVRKEEYITAERGAGFFPVHGGEIATGGFYVLSRLLHIHGRVTNGDITREKYWWDPEFLAIASL